MEVDKLGLSAPERAQLRLALWDRQTDLKNRMAQCGDRPDMADTKASFAESLVVVDGLLLKLFGEAR